MNKRQIQRFKNLIRAVEEGKNHTIFHMTSYGNKGGTPSCVLGHYAARHDLQRTFALASAFLCKYKHRNRPISYTPSIEHYSSIVQEHFGITARQAMQLFSVVGCGNARNDREKAINYLRNFLRNKFLEKR